MVVKANPNFNTSESKFNVKFICKNPETEINKYDVVPTVEYFDFFRPNKYGLILRERLFVNDQENFVSFKLKLGRVANPPEKDEPSNNTKAAKGGKGGKHTSSGGGRQPVEPVNEKYLVTLEFYREEELLKKVGGYNEAELLNLTLQGAKDDHANYYLQARFDLREIEPEVCRGDNEFTKGLCWTLQASSTNVSPIYPNF